MRYRYTSHESFDHDSIDALGYDWERVADPNIKPKFVKYENIERTRKAMETSGPAQRYYAHRPASGDNSSPRGDAACRLHAHRWCSPAQSSPRADIGVSFAHGRASAPLSAPLSAPASSRWRRRSADPR